jgi:hypothetical protein
MGDRRKSPSRRTFKGRARRKHCRVDQDHGVSFCACWGRRSNEIFDNAHLGNARPDAGADGVHGRSAATEYSTTAYVGGGISPRGELTKPVLPGGFFFAQQNGPSARLTALRPSSGVCRAGDTTQNLQLASPKSVPDIFTSRDWLISFPSAVTQLGTLLS